MKNDIFKDFSLHVRSIKIVEIESKTEGAIFIDDNSKLKSSQYQIRRFHKINTIALEKYYTKQ